MVLIRDNANKIALKSMNRLPKVKPVDINFWNFQEKLDI